MTLQVRMATVEEAPLVHHTMVEAFAQYVGKLQPPSSVTRETVEDVVKAMSEGGGVVAYYDDQIAGSARFRLYPDYMYVGRVSVLPAFRGKGIGAKLMAFIENHARSIGISEIRLMVRMALPENLLFYEHLGYEILSVDPHHTDPSADIATMAKHL